MKDTYSPLVIEALEDDVGLPEEGRDVGPVAAQR